MENWNDGILEKKEEFFSWPNSSTAEPFSILFYLSDGVHMITLSPLRYFHQATKIDALTIRK